MRLIVVAVVLLSLCLSGCGSNERADASARKAEATREDSLMAVIRQAQDRSAQRGSRIVNPATLADSAAATGAGKFSAFSDSAIQTAAPRATGPGRTPTATATADTAATLEAAIATNANYLAVDSGSAEDRRLDSLMLIANTLASNYQRMVMNHTHRNLAQAAHQNPAKTRRLRKKITELAPERIAQESKVNQIRQQRLQALREQAAKPNY
jgi:hypothetical protein